MQNESELDTTLRPEQRSLGAFIASRKAYYVKNRMIDVVLALCLLILFIPLMLLIAVAILIYSPGPVFFIQQRVGGKLRFRGTKQYWQRGAFSCYKFRTMRLNADASVHQAYVKALIDNDAALLEALQGEATSIRKLIHDSRITPPGRFLRKTSLDELPQLLNVLRGDMSLVGPRPAIPYEVEMYKPWHLRRLEAQPGITGLQQVVARSTADFDQQVLLDIDYIEHQSIWLDLKIMIKTPLVILSAKGAE